MSDSEQTTARRTGASGAAWSEAEKIAYLIILCENGGKLEERIANTPIPAGRSTVSCKKLIWRLNGKHKNEIEKIKSGQPILAQGEANGADAAEKPNTLARKRKSKAETGTGAEVPDDESPKKKSTPRKRKKDEVVDGGAEMENMI